MTSQYEREQTLRVLGGSVSADVIRSNPIPVPNFAFSIKIQEFINARIRVLR